MGRVRHVPRARGDPSGVLPVDRPPDLGPRRARLRDKLRHGSALGEARQLCYGAPKMVLELRKAGIRASRRRVARLMSENGMAGTCGVGPERPGAPKEKPETDNAEDLARRDLEADGPNRAWFADITYVKTYQGWPCVAVVIDIWSRMVVGWAMGPRITAELADDAPRMAIARRRPAGGCIHHGDYAEENAKPQKACSVLMSAKTAT